MNILFNRYFIRYFNHKWNYIDIAGCFFYFIGFTLRLISIKTTEDVFIAARYDSYDLLK